MKKLFLLSTFLLSSFGAMAQINVQLHYDGGRQISPRNEANRQILTLTGEIYQGDITGYTYAYLDLDYHDKRIGRQTALGAYWEIGHNFIALESDDNEHTISAHVEYDGNIKYNDHQQHALLLGPAWQWSGTDHRRTFELQLLYKQYFKRHEYKAIPTFQVSALWNINFANGLCSFDGFFDVWRGHINSFDPNVKDLIIITEPQLWFHVIGRYRQHNRLSVGTEFEMSNEYIWPVRNNRSFFINPTLGAKYTF